MYTEQVNSVQSTTFIQYLDGVHAGVGLHPLDTVLGLVRGQLPGGDNVVFIS